MPARTSNTANPVRLEDLIVLLASAGEIALAARMARAVNRRR